MTEQRAFVDNWSAKNKKCRESLVRKFTDLVIDCRYKRLKVTTPNLVSIRMNKHGFMNSNWQLHYET